jgi:hypothetical protein
MFKLAIAKSMLIPRQIFVRAASAAGMTMLGVFFLGLVPFFGVEPTAGAGFARTPAFSVNREFKGDRLPVTAEIQSAIPSSDVRSQARSQSSQQIPFGCDASFSPISAPHLAHIYGRCMS